MQLLERNAVSSPSIVGQIRVGRDIHGRDEREARLPAQEGRGIPHARAAAGAAAMFGRARPAPPPWLCSAGLCGAGSAPPLMSARGGPATCASRPPHGRTDAAPAARHRHGRTERPAAEGGKRPLQLTAEPAPPAERREGGDRTGEPKAATPSTGERWARLRTTGEPAATELPVIPAPSWNHAC